MDPHPHTADEAPAGPLDANLATEVSGRSRAESSECRHCGLPVPNRRRADGDTFCCEGCKRVFELIQDSDLAAFYDMGPVRGLPASSSRDDETFTWLERLLPEGSTGLRRFRLQLEGVHCAACVWLLQQVFDREPGAVSLRINSARGTAEFWWNPELGDLRHFLRAAARFGYRFGPPSARTASATRGLMMRMGLAIALAMNVMIFSFCFYFGLGPEDGAVFTFVGWLSFALTTGAVLVSGSVFVPSAVRALRQGIVHLDLPIALGLVLAFSGSVFAFQTRGAGETYFDTVSIFAALMLVGRWLQARVVERNRASVSRSEGTEGLFVRRLRVERPEVIPIGAVETGDRILVVPGDLIPVRSRIEATSGAATLSLEWISGEAEPVSFGPEVEVPAGSRNVGTSALEMTALESFEDSRLEELLETSRSEPIATSGAKWGRISLLYVSVVLTLSSGALLFWWSRDPVRAFETAVAILVVTCPCALGLAVPLAYELAQLGLRRRGIFVRSETLLDRARRVRRIYFDKTGTLTSGNLELDRDSRRQLHDLSEPHREALAALALCSNHPRSRTLFAALTSGDLGLRPASFDRSVEETAGQGLAGGNGDNEFRLGRPDFALSAESARFVPQDRTAFTENGRLVASFRFDEELRSDAASEIQALREGAYRVRILSGDGAERTRAAAAQLGLAEDDALGGLRPADKAVAIEAESGGRALMVGDGLNDVPGFAAADVCATPATDLPTLPSRVDFCYLGEGITAVRRVLTCAGHLGTVVRDLLIAAALYNVTVLTFALTGHLGAVEAAILMPASSISLVLFTRYRMQTGNPTWKF